MGTDTMSPLAAVSMAHKVCVKTLTSQRSLEIDICAATEITPLNSITLLVLTDLTLGILRCSDFEL